MWSSRRDGANATAFEYVTTLHAGGAAYSSLLAARAPWTYLALFERDGSAAIALTSFAYADWPGAPWPPSPPGLVEA